MHDSIDLLAEWNLSVGGIGTSKEKFANFEKLIFLFGSPNDIIGYTAISFYPWGMNKTQFGTVQPNISLTVEGAAARFRFISDTEIEYKSGPVRLRTIYGFRRR